ncbi:MAG: ABC transporter substrate-binding protein [Maritimibacter sp.]|uniref:ABC transporter substrate-binding protein n=1 Tax=Psychromarinibacter halotolerans TaxID=1775175 RepID=A0ABV7GIB9_9RHOB|nr:ABC transporter substrate-binding protein [Maritimibacter sp.]
MHLNKPHLLTRRGLGGLALGLAFATGAMAQDDAITIGVTAPVTGPAAQYGEAWVEGFDLALETINAEGGINGTPLEYVIEDSQNDPRQAVAIAQKFIADPNIVVEAGDLSSTTSMAASPLYQRAGLVQFGFTNSHPDFTKTGDYIWSSAIPQSQEQPLLAEIAYNDLGMRKVAVLHLNTDWGTTAKNLFVESFEALGGEIVAAEGYLPEEKDFRATITRVMSGEPDGIILESYYGDGALVTRQVREAGIELPILGVSSLYSPDFLDLAGEFAEGVYTTTYFAPNIPRPEVQDFIAAFEEAYGHAPNSFNAMAYDTMNILAAVMREYGTSREEIKDGLGQISGLPSVIFRDVTFDVESRRVAGPEITTLVVEDGEFAIFEAE